MRRWSLGLVLPLFFGAVSACSSSEENGQVDTRPDSGRSVIFMTGTGNAAGVGSSGYSNGGGVGAGGTGSPASGSGGANGAAGSCPVTVNDAGCTGSIYVGETIPLDIYVMFDQSGSMTNVGQDGVTRMDAVRTAVDEFLKDPKSAGLGVGIGYFGNQPIGQTTCAPGDYSSEAVAIGALPGNAQAIVDSLSSKVPTGETPTGAAIRGACTYAKSFSQANPGHEVVILLVTDGKPEAPVTCQSGGCCPTLDDAVAAATECLDGDRGLRTYVLGVGQLLDNLGQIAVAGGTKNAYLVASGDVSQEVLAALNAIRESASIPCKLKIPPAPSGETLDLRKINVVHTTNACDVRVIPYRDVPSTCDSAIGGWYFDDPATPQTVKLCGKTCEDVSIPGGQLLFSVGCGRLSVH
jgi:von Willebrand factor type A domain